MSLPRLFGDRPKRKRWTGSRALVPLAADRCPSCNQALESTVVEQPALLRHGGYGATERTTTRRCPCGWRMVAETQEVKP